MIRLVTRGLLALALLLAVTSPAAAQLSLGPIVGAVTGHVGTATGTEGLGTTLSAGFSMAVVESTGWGVEFDAGFANGDARDGGLDAQSYVLNLVGMWPKGRLRPFFTAGGGAIRGRTCRDTCAETTAWTDWAVSAGGGVQYFFNTNVGLRGDARYFTTAGDHPDPARSLSFWRVALGATFVWSAD